MRILALLCLALSLVVGRAQVMSVGTTNDLAMLPNPSSIHSNTLVTAETTVGDNTMAVWTWVKGLAAAPAGATVLDSLTHPGEGLFVKGLQAMNVAGTNYFYTIITTNLTVIETNTVNYMIVTNITVISNITVAGTNVATINPTDGYVPYRTGTNSFGDSYARQDSDGFWLFTNDVVATPGGGLLLGPHTSNYFGYLPGGGELFNYRNTDLGDSVGFSLTFGSGPTSATTNRSLALFEGDNTYSQVLVSHLDASGNLSDFGANARDIGTYILVRSVGNTNFYVADASGYTGTGTNVFTDNGMFQHLIDYDDLTWTNKSGILQPVNLTLPMMWTNSVDFSGGGTNTLRLVGSQLTLTNKSITNGFQIANRSDTHLDLGFTGTGANPRISSPSGFLWMGNNTIFEGNVLPDADNTRNLGSSASSGAWHDSWFKGTHYIESTNDGLGNTSWMKILSTNGVGIFDLANAGTGFAPAGFSFRTNGVENFRILGNMWTDSMVPAVAFKTGATAPSFDDFAGGPAKAYMFQNARDDEVHFSVQLNHNYLQNSSISPHLHFAETAATGAGTGVVWELVSTWANVGTAFPAYSTNYVTNAVSGTLWKHQLADFPHLTGAGKTVSSILVCRLRRLASSATADDYDQSVAVLGFDIHYQVDSPGSDSELTKSF